MGVHGKILKCAMSWKWLTVERNWWKFGTCGTVLCRVLSCPILWVQLRSFGALCKIPDVNIFKRLLLPQFFIQFQPNFRESMWPGKIQAMTFSGDLAKLSLSIWHFDERLPQLHCHYPSGILVSSGKRSSSASRPLCFLCKSWSLW